MTKSFIAIVLLAALTTTAEAQPKARAARPASSSKAKKPAAANAATPKKPVYFDFTGDEIDGDRIRPDGTTIFGLRSARHGSLIKLRGDFLREIVKTGERL